MLFLSPAPFFQLASDFNFPPIVAPIRGWPASILCFRLQESLTYDAAREHQQSFEFVSVEFGQQGPIAALLFHECASVKNAACPHQFRNATYWSPSRKHSEYYMIPYIPQWVGSRGSFIEHLIVKSNFDVCLGVRTFGQRDRLGYRLTHSAKVAIKGLSDVKAGIATTLDAVLQAYDRHNLGLAALN